MMFQKGKTNLIFIILVVVIMAIIGTGLFVYIHNANQQEDFLDMSKTKETVTGGCNSDMNQIDCEKNGGFYHTYAGNGVILGHDCECPSAQTCAEVCTKGGYVYSHCNSWSKNGYVPYSGCSNSQEKNSGWTSDCNGVNTDVGRKACCCSKVPVAAGCANDVCDVGEDSENCPQDCK